MYTAAAKEGSTSFHRSPPCSPMFQPQLLNASPNQEESPSKIYTKIPRQLGSEKKKAC